jgi:hypothetical protein
MIKRKSAKTQPAASEEQKSKGAAPDAKSNGHVKRASAVARALKAPTAHSEPTAEKLHGLLQEFNFSPKGGVEGFLLRVDGKTIQVNVTPDVGFAVVRGIGKHVEATVVPEPATSKHGKRDHPVYSLVTLTAADGKVLIHAGASEGEIVSVQGVVKQINYARHGEANGVILETGDFVYLKPDGMKAIEVKVGDQITAEGKSAMMPLGQQVIEAKTVNGTAIVSKKPGRPAGRRSRS